MSGSLDRSPYYAPPQPWEQSLEQPGESLSLSECCRGDAAAAADDEAAREQARGSVRRLAVALGLAVVLAFLCWVLAPQWGVHLPMIVPLMGFASIAVGTIMAAAEAQPKRTPQGEDGAPGRPMCCGGPRPVGERLRMMNDGR